jgi:PAS domain S-box-containing protein
LRNLLGYKPEELIGQKYIDFVHPDDIAKHTKVAESIMSGASVNDFENRYRKKDESYVPVIWVAMWSEEEKMMYGYC